MASAQAIILHHTPDLTPQPPLVLHPSPVQYLSPETMGIPGSPSTWRNSSRSVVHNGEPTLFDQVGREGVESGGT